MTAAPAGAPRVAAGPAPGRTPPGGALTAAAAWGTILGLPVALLALALAAHLVAGGAALLPGLVAGQLGTLANTGAYGLLTAAVVTAVAWALAHAHHSYAFPGRRVVHLLTLAPLLMPSFTVAIALVILLGHNGWLTGLTGARADLYGLPGLVAASAFARLPFAYLALLLAYRLIDARRLDAARDLGASRGAALRAVAWPGLRGPLLAVALVAFADTVADLANPLVIGGGFPVVASRLYESVAAEGDLAAGSAFALLLLLPAALAVVASRRVAAFRGRGGPVGPVPAPSRRPRGAGWALVAASWAVAGAVAVLLGVVVAASLVPAGRGLALDSFAGVLAGPHTRALATTVLLACVAVPLVIGGSVVATLAAAPRRRWLSAAGHATRALAAVPSVVLGLAALLLALALPDAGGGPPTARALTLGAVVVLVHVVRGVPTATPPMLAVARTLPDVRDAAVQLGARGPALARAVYLPRLRPAVRAAVLTTGARALTATSSVVLLSDQQLPLLTHRMLVEADAGRLSSAAAMTVVLGLLVAAIGLAAAAGWSDERR